MIKLASQFVALKVNAEKEGRQLAGKYKVRGFPTILFLDPAGEVVGRIGGYLPPAPFAEQMKRIHLSFTEFPKIQALLKENPEDGEANARMAGALAGRGKLKEAEGHLGKAEKARVKAAVLAPTLNAVGDLHQEDGKLDEAITYFRKADQAEVPAADRSYAKASILSCYLAKNDLKNARKEAKALVDFKEAAPEHQKMAQEILKRLGE